MIRKQVRPGEEESGRKRNGWEDNDKIARGVCALAASFLPALFLSFLLAFGPVSYVPSFGRVPLPTPTSVNILALFSPPLSRSQLSASPTFSTSTHSPRPLPPRAPSSLPLLSASCSFSSGMGSGPIFTRNASQFHDLISRIHSIRSASSPIAYMTPGCPILEKPMSDNVEERETIFLRLVVESKWCETNKA